jgi:hypothetical protein
MLPYNSVITPEEIEEQLSKTLSGKSPGPDGLVYEHLKHAHPLLITAFTLLYNFFWDSGEIPKELKDMHLTLVYKKGPTEDISNFRPIACLNVFEKLFEKCLESRTKNYLDMVDGIHVLQGMGHKTAGTSELAVAATELVLNAKRKKENLILTALDLSKGFDRVPRELLWQSLAESGIKGKLWMAIKSTYDGAHTKIKIKGSTSKEFSFQQGIKQGSPLSPLLYVIYMRRLLVKLQESLTGPTIGNFQIPGLMYVDDLLLASRNVAELKLQSQIVKQTAAEWGFVINNSKTQVICRKDEEQVRNAARSLWGVKKLGQTLLYLGVHICAKNLGGVKHWEKRCSKLLEAYHSLKRIGMRWDGLNQSLNLELFQTILVPILTYGAETTTPSKSTLNKINAAQARPLRQLSGLKWNANTKWTIWEQGMRSATTLIEEKKLRTALKITRAPSHRILSKIRAELVKDPGAKDLHIVKQAHQIATAWGVPHWLSETESININSDNWKDEKFAAVQAREEELFDDWAAPANNPSRYHDLKPWYGTNDLPMDLNDVETARLIFLARADQVGVGSDHTYKSNPLNKTCTLCDQNEEDTLAHATLECTHASLRSSQDALRHQLETLAEQDLFWEETLDSGKEAILHAVLQAPADLDKTLEQETLTNWSLMSPLIADAQRLRRDPDP